MRYIGLENLMRLRQNAKMGLKKMEAMGQMGNSEEATIPDDMPFDMADLLNISLEDQFSDLSLDDLFPDITNPLVPMGIGTPFATPGGDTGSLNLPGVDPRAVTAGGVTGGNIPYNNLSTQQKLDILFGRS